MYRRLPLPRRGRQRLPSGLEPSGAAPSARARVWQGRPDVARRCRRGCDFASPRQPPVHASKMLAPEPIGLRAQPKPSSSFPSTRLPRWRRLGHPPATSAGRTMALEGLLDTEQERAARRLIEQAGTILTGLHGDMPEGFAAQIFARAAPEDLARYEPREIAALAEEAWLFLKERAPGKAKVRMQSRSGPIGSERMRTVSILEIVNDNMPFLLDSIMGELTEQGLDVRLVVHPVFSVERDTAGSLIGFSGEGTPTAAGQRESFIHIHTERVDDAPRRAALVQSIEQALV